MSDIKEYKRQKKEPEMLNDFGPAGGYDCLYPDAPKMKDGNNNFEKVKKESVLDKYGNGGDVLNASEEEGE